MDKEFEDYWNLHQRHLILSAPGKLRSEYMEAGRLDSPADWICFILPVGVGMLLQPFLNFSSEILAQVRKSVDSPPGMLTEDHHHTVHEERQVCYSSHLRPKPLHL